MERKKLAVLIGMLSILIAGSAWSLRSSVISKIHHSFASKQPMAAMATADEHPVLISTEKFRELLTSAIDTETSTRAWVGSHLAFAVTASTAHLPTATICGIVERALTRYEDATRLNRWPLRVLGAETHTADALLHATSTCPTTPHHETIVALQWLDGAGNTIEERAFRERHPLTDAQLLAVLAWAESHDFLYAAINFARQHRNRIAPEIFRRLEMRVADFELTSAMHNRRPHEVIELVTTRPTSIAVPEFSGLVERQFDALLRDGNIKEALDLANRPKSGLTDAHRMRAAHALYDDLLGRLDPLNAYRVAIMYHLSPLDVRRAADAAFAAAERSGAYTLARQLPDGTLMILK
ncbi:hypothetical protein HY632_02900 [Candidatus Uhrbacteria bacterium]|nr:hypothetical protein [Candidatus Uhrbacteria bacterium]